MKPFDLIIGTHSIAAALKNSQRSKHWLFATGEGLQKLFKEYPDLKNLDFKQEKLSAHEFQEETKYQFKELGYEYRRIPSGLLLKTSVLAMKSAGWLFSNLKPDSKILCLDQVSDIHNAAAILRTASFYGVDALVLSSKGNFGLTPAFYRLASGGSEHVTLIQVSNLSKFLTQLQEKNVRCLGLSEHAEAVEVEKKEGPLCLVLGSEEKGISHAVLRVLNEKISLLSQGSIVSLNVSVAAGVAMEKFFIRGQC